MDSWTDRLSEYLDGELSAAERRELEAHVETCATCSATLAELRQVVARAAALEDRPPQADLWAGIRERIEPGERTIELSERRPGRTRRFSFSLPQLVAASIALMLVSGGAAWMMTSGSGEPSTPGPVAATESPRLTSPVTAGMEGSVPVANFAERKYGAAIADLERVLAENRDQLDPQTVRVIEENLETIDVAIGQARRALADDPASDYLNTYLATTMRQKLELLRRAAVLAGASS